MMGGSHRLRSDSLDEPANQWLNPGVPILTKAKNLIRQGSSAGKMEIPANTIKLDGDEERVVLGHPETTHRHVPVAVLGKALSPLTEGQGLVETLVSLR